ncbi:MAG: helix-turn-helix transcriptional regulator [Cyclobacteriaceae bacterium]|nr:helix-turn-helix transcriptional regulator [Cyclobacteriaceae bacterium]
MKKLYTPKSIGEVIRKTRKLQKVTQKDLALTSGTGLRFIIDLEKGKPTCQIGKTITVLNTLGIQLDLTHRLFQNEIK